MMRMKYKIVLNVMVNYVAYNCSVCIVSIMTCTVFFKNRLHQLMMVFTKLITFRLLSGHLLGKELLTRLTICSLFIVTICIFSVLVLRAEFWF